MNITLHKTTAAATIYNDLPIYSSYMAHDVHARYSLQCVEATIVVTPVSAETVVIPSRHIISSLLMLKTFCTNLATVVTSITYV